MEMDENSSDMTTNPSYSVPMNLHFGDKMTSLSEQTLESSSPQDLTINPCYNKMSPLTRRPSDMIVNSCYDNFQTGVGALSPQQT